MLRHQTVSARRPDGWLVQQGKSTRSTTTRISSFACREVLRHLGAAVINLPVGEIFPALQSGAIDGTEWVGPWHDIAAGFYKVAKFYYWPGWHEPGTTGEVLVNLKEWEGLSDEHKAIIRAGVGAEAWQEFSEFNAHTADPNVQALTARHRERDDLQARAPPATAGSFHDP